MPFYKVPSPENTSVPEVRKSRTPLEQSQMMSRPDYSSSTLDSSSSASGSGSNFGTFSDDDGGYVSGGKGYNRTADYHVDGHQRVTYDNRNSQGAAYYNKLTTEPNGNRNMVAVPDQQVSIVELEIQQQGEREAELLAMRQALYQSQPISPQNSLSNSHHHPIRTSAPVGQPSSSFEPRTGVTNERTKQEHVGVSSSSFSSSSFSAAASRAPMISYEEAISTQSHPGETLIAREIMELKKREDELRRRRKVLDPPDRNGISNHHSASSSFDPIVSSQSHSALPKSNNSVDSVVTDDRPTKRTSRIQPLDEPDAAEAFLPQKETPIERETRLIKEREDALRQARGLPVEGEDGRRRVVEFEVVPSVSGSSALRHGSDERRTDQTMKKLASSLLMVEIEKEKQRELEVRRQWQHKAPPTQQPPKTTSSSSSYGRRY